MRTPPRRRSCALDLPTWPDTDWAPPEASPIVTQSRAPAPGQRSVSLRRARKPSSSRSAARAPTTMSPPRSASGSTPSRRRSRTASRCRLRGRAVGREDDETPRHGRCRVVVVIARLGCLDRARPDAHDRHRRPRHGADARRQRGVGDRQPRVRRRVENEPGSAEGDIGERRELDHLRGGGDVNVDRTLVDLVVGVVERPVGGAARDVSEGRAEVEAGEVLTPGAGAIAGRAVGSAVVGDRDAADRAGRVGPGDGQLRGGVVSKA